MREEIVNGAGKPLHPSTTGGGQDDDDGVPFWAAGFRQDIRSLSRDIKDLGRDFRSDVKDLGKEFRAGIKAQTYALMLLALVAMALNTAVVVGMLKIKIGGDSVEIETQRDVPATTAP